MAIIGLGSDYYCAHNPLPVEVTGMPTNSMTMQVRIGGVNQIAIPPVFYSIGGVFKVDLSGWVRQFMVPMAETKTYTTTPVIGSNTNIRQMEVVFTSSGINQTITRRFVHCALDSYHLSDFEDDCCVRIWKGYPFSAPVAGWNQKVMFIPNTDIEPDVDICGCVHYDRSMCEGTYIKWLNAKGYYSYWLFPPALSITRDGDELFKMPRNIFNPDRSSNEDTAGFKTEEYVKVFDKIPRIYWDQLKTIVGSPEVYMLSPTWKPGRTSAQPSDWIKIIQDSPTFERNRRNRTADFEMTFELPKVFTQKRI